MVFYSKEDEFLKINAGSPTNMYYVVRVIESGLASATHFAYGQLKQVGTQLFADVMPELAPGSFFELRQKTNQNDVVAITIRVPSKGVFLKDPVWHHQEENKEQFYYKELHIDGRIVQFAIGSGLSMNQLFTTFDEKANSTL